MAAKQQDQRRLVAQIAAASRWGKSEEVGARLELRASRLEQHIRLAVASDPSLTQEQRLKLADLLIAGGGLVT